MTKAKLAEALLPPVLYRFILRVYLWAIRGHGWHLLYGRYPTLADVPATPGGQDSDWYAELSIKEVGDIAPEISRRPLGDGAGLLVLPLLVSELLSREGETLTVLDFGGGAASGLKEIFERVPNPVLAKLRYVLVETPALVSAVRQTKLGGASYVELAEKIPSSLSHPLIVHARSSIQYIPDYRAALSELLALSPDIFIVAHTPVTDAPTFAQQQGNLSHQRLARWVLNRGELISEVEKAGYRLSLIFDHEAPITYKGSGPLNDVSMIFHRLAPQS
jgi:putative methyltransferase (TIGR04325 family)